ncbi:MAG: CDP-alcohol phosphatidyltransferase family protein [Elusimicrobiota bacterium]
MNLPNKISFARILFVPAFIITVVYNVKHIPLGIFSLCMISDALDGLVARLSKSKTRLGTFLDPAGDKLLLISAFMIYAIKGVIPWWLTIVILMRDILIVHGWLFLYLVFNITKVSPSALGKSTTFMQMLTVLCILVKGYIPIEQYLIYLYYLTGLVTILSGFDYLRTSIKGVQE